MVSNTKHLRIDSLRRILMLPVIFLFYFYNYLGLKNVLLATTLLVSNTAAAASDTEPAVRIIM